MAGPTLSQVRKQAFLRALHMRCPQCGEGRLMRSFAKLHEACPECELVFRREPGAGTGSMYLSAAVTQVLAVILIALVWNFTDWGPGVSIAVVAPVVLLLCFAFLPYSQAIWVAAEYSTDFVNKEEWVEPRL